MTVYASSASAGGRLEHLRDGRGRERFDDHLPCAVIQWPAFLGERLHRRAVGADQDHEHRRTLKRAIPQQLQHGLDRRFLRDQVGQLVDHENHRSRAARATDRKGQRRLPRARARPGTYLHARGNIAVGHRCHEAFELLRPWTLHGGVEHRWRSGALDQLLYQSALAYSPAATDRQQAANAGTSHPLQRAFQACQLPLAADKRMGGGGSSHRVSLQPKLDQPFLDVCDRGFDWTRRRLLGRQATFSDSALGEAAAASLSIFTSLTRCSYAITRQSSDEDPRRRR